MLGFFWGRAQACRKVAGEGLGRVQGAPPGVCSGLGRTPISELCPIHGGGPWVLTLCGPCADLREAPQPVSSGAEHATVQCSLLSGSPQTGGWEAGRGHPEEGPPPRVRPWRPRVPRPPCPALPLPGMGGVSWEPSVGLRKTRSPHGGQRHSDTEDRGVWGPGRCK